MITLNQIRAWIVTCLGIAAALYSAVEISDKGMGGFSILLAATFTVVWVLFGRAYWWMPLFMGMGVGGLFYFGFKVYPSEVGVCLALVAALPLIALRVGQPVAHRILPRGVLLFLIYLVVSAVWSWARYANGSVSQAGSICRIYLAAVWPLLFILTFRYYGESRSLSKGFYLFEALLCVRLVFGVVAFFVSNFTYVPGLNLILPGSGPSGGSDLRTSGLWLSVMGLMLLFYRRGPIHLLFQLFLLLVGGAGVVMGGGRAPVIGLLLALFMAGVFARSRWVLGAIFCAVILVFGFVNVRPDVVDQFPRAVKRGLSILIVDKETRQGMSPEIASLEGKGSTNDWHESLQRIGWQRWTSSLPVFFFGTGVRPYDYSILKESNPDVSFQLALNVGADTLAYEAGWWTVVAGLGTIGLFFYVILFGGLIGQIWRCRKFIAETPFGRPLVFLACYSVVDWSLFSYWKGGFPSDQLMLTFMAAVYLQDRAAEAKMNEESA